MNVGLPPPPPLSIVVSGAIAPQAAASSGLVDGVAIGDLAAREGLSARRVEVTCYNPAGELSELCVAFNQSVSGAFNDSASRSQDAVLLLSTSNQSIPALFVTANKGALSLLFDFFRTGKVFDCEKKWLRLKGQEPPLELIEMGCSVPLAMARAMHLCHWLNECPEGSPWPEYADAFDQSSCLSVIQAIEHLSCDRPKNTARLVQAHLWSTIERELVSAVCDCAVFGVYEDEEGGRMLLLSVIDCYFDDSCTSSCSDDCSDGEVEFDSIKLGKLVDGMNQNISSLPDNSPLRKRFARCCHRALSPCISRKGAAAVNRLIDKPLVEFSQDSPAIYFATSPPWMEAGFCDGGRACSHQEDYGYFITAEADQEDPITWALTQKTDGSDWFVQTRTYTHPHKAGYRITSVALVKKLTLSERDDSFSANARATPITDATGTANEWGSAVSSTDELNWSADVQRC